MVIIRKIEIKIGFLSFQRGAFVSEPAILVKRKADANQVWSIEKLDSKLIDMRELYEDLKVSLDEYFPRVFLILYQKFNF